MWGEGGDRLSFQTRVPALTPTGRSHARRRCGRPPRGRGRCLLAVAGRGRRPPAQGAAACWGRGGGGRWGGQGDVLRGAAASVVAPRRPTSIHPTQCSFSSAPRPPSHSPPTFSLPPSPLLNLDSLPPPLLSLPALSRIGRLLPPLLCSLPSFASPPVPPPVPFLLPFRPLVTGTSEKSHGGGVGGGDGGGGGCRQRAQPGPPR